MSEAQSKPTLADLKREAKRISKASGAPHHEALDQVAQKQGFRNWSLLSKASVHGGRACAGATPLIPNEFITALTDLGFTTAHAAAIEWMKDRAVGLFIVGGHAGTGRSTTVQRVLLAQVKERSGIVLALEEMPELPLPGVLRLPVASYPLEESKQSLTAAMAAGMRLDPRTIVIDEVRNSISASAAVRASMSGHQVWTTVHAPDAISIMDRMDSLLADGDAIYRRDHVHDPMTIAGLISQRLVRVLCPQCKVKLASRQKGLDSRLAQRVHSVVRDFSQVYVQGDGCAHCNHTGVTGRTVLAEVIIPDLLFMQLLKEGDKRGAYSHWRTRMGGRTLHDHAIEKIEAGIVDPAMAEDQIGLLTD